MVIRNDINTLNSIANASPASSQPGGSSNGKPADNSVQAVDRATLSTAGTGISQSAGEMDVRWDKVAAVQQALANGTYNVPTSAVASTMVDAMLGERS